MMKFRLIPRDSKPKRVHGKAKNIDHYDFKGEYNIEVLKIGNKGLPNPDNNKYYKNGGDSQK